MNRLLIGHKTAQEGAVFPPELGLLEQPKAGCAFHSRPFDLCKLWNSSALFPQIARKAFPIDSAMH
jgi:hypothetical protein